MSFRCDNCDEARPGGERPTKIVTAKRLKHYDDSFGFEVEREVDIGQCCADEITEVPTPMPWDSDNALKQLAVPMAYEQGAANKHFANQIRMR